MISVFVSGNGDDAAAVCSLGNRLQEHFSFRESPETTLVNVKFAETMDTCLFSASRESGVKISTWQSDAISRYSEKPRETYLLACALLGLTQWRTLILNPLLLWEDFMVREEKPACLYAVRKTVQEYALAFERPYVCKGCLEFFRCLGAENEIAALQQVLAFMSHQHQYSNSL